MAANAISHGCRRVLRFSCAHPDASKRRFAHEEERMSQSFRSRLKDWKLDRRRFLYATGGLAGLVATSPLQALTEKVTPSFSTNPFTLGVASGDPLADSVMLWTRLAPEPLAADGSGGMDPVRVPVHWNVATDDRMRHVVRRGVTFADPDFAHSVHVDVDRLEPGRWYWYQFHVRGEWSPIGRTRTLVPHRDSPQRIRFAFASCQHFEMGFYNAYQHMAQRGPRPGAVPRRLHLRGRRVAGAAAAARRPRADDRRRLPQPPRALQERREPAGHARRLSVAGGVRRSRGGEQLGRPVRRERIGARALPAAPRRRVPGLLRAHAAARRDRSRAARTCSCSAGSRSATWRSSTCSTRGSIATTRPAATAPTSAAPKRSIRTGRSPGPSRNAGCSAA